MKALQAGLIALVMTVIAPVVSAQTNTNAPPPLDPPESYIPEIALEAAAEGNSAFARGDMARARKAYQQVLSAVPDNLIGLVNLGVVEFSLGNMPEAELLLKRAVAKRLETPAAWLTLGIIYMDGDRLDEALASLTQATLYDPRNARARNYLGVVVGRKGWLDAAESELRKAIEIDPKYSDAHYNLAVFYLQRNPPAFELARRHYYRAVELGAEKDLDIEKTLKSNLPPQ